MTDKTPPEGKVWIAYEYEADSVNHGVPGNATPVSTVFGPKPPETPRERALRLLHEAEFKFRDAGEGFRPWNPIGTGVSELMEGTRYLAEALKALREEL